jgi:enamine deaminase RidA (YjgF/YER057c/UK114 family)
MRDTPAVKLSNPTEIHEPIGYSHVAEVLRGKLVFVAGQVALDTQGNLVGKDDFAAQAHQVFQNLAAALTATGATFHDLVKMNIFCADAVDLAKELPALRSIRDSFVNTAAPPVSTLVVVGRLARPEWLIEIEAVAAVSATLVR